MGAQSNLTSSPEHPLPRTNRRVIVCQSVLELKFKRSLTALLVDASNNVPHIPLSCLFPTISVAFKDGDAQKGDGECTPPSP